MKIFRLFVFVAAFLGSVEARATVRITIDLSTQSLTASRPGGETVVWKISSGRRGYETPTGHYSVMRMEADHFSDEYDQAPMPYAIFFSPRGLAIHGSYERKLGRPASHGCVRLSVANAQKLFEWVEQQGGASIDIVGGGGARGEEMARVKEEDRPRPTRRRRPPEPGSLEYELEQAARY
jgi:hypothetical protein